MIITQTFTMARWQIVVKTSEATKQTKDQNDNKKQTKQNKNNNNKTGGGGKKQTNNETNGLVVLS